MTPERAGITVAIPTYRRERVLVETLEYLLALSPPADEILVLDQTEQHAPETMQALQALADKGAIRWERLAEPSIPKAMNEGLRQARQPLVLFLDDDIRPEPDLLSGHLLAHGVHDQCLVAGRVIQPWEEHEDFSHQTGFRFAGLNPAWISEFMGGNFSLPRDAALAMGGFDENFVKVAYRFEAEFAYRWQQSGRKIWFEPSAALHHLKDAAGGTRTFGEHLTTWRPDHAVGAYYHALRTGGWKEFLLRPFRSVLTRHHLAHPGHILRTLWAECRGMLWALRLYARGPAYLASGRQAAEAAEGPGA